MAAASRTDDLTVRLLLVEDSPLDAELVSEQLRQAGGPRSLEIQIAGTSAEAASILRHDPPDCVLLDLTLPDASGLESLHELHHAAPDIPIVVLSGAESPELALRAVSEGAQDFLVKGEAPGPLVARALRYAIERKQSESQLAEMALTDALTGLPNRVRLKDRIEHALARLARTEAVLALLFLDLDRFKFVNDALGHAAGDRLLIEVATRLREAVRPADTVARFGGDEFVVLCEDLHSAAEAEVVVRRIHASLSAPLHVDGHELTTAASIGVAIADSPGDSADRLLSDADAAMYRAKEQGRGHVHFAEEMAEQARERLALETELHRALRTGELELHYQPQMDLENGLEQITGMEALLRWRHPTRGLLGPDAFVGAAEETGLIRPIGQWVIERASRQLAIWSKLAGAPLEMSVNLSPRQLTDPGLVDVVREVIARNGLEPGQLCLEITESALVDPRSGAAERILELKQLGVKIALDDFGTGYASLSMLTQVPLDILKIDRSFVGEMRQSDANRRIVSAVAGLGQGLGLQIVAEGVEDPTLYAELADIGCHRAQGFAFARPISATDIATLLDPRMDGVEEGLEPLRVFLCDDQEDVRYLLRLSFEDDEEIVVTGEAADGEGIVEAVRAAGVDVVILDLAMPNSDGLDAIARLRTDLPTIGIVALSAFDSMRGPALALGADRYVEKHTSMEELREVLMEVAAERIGGRFDGRDSPAEQPA